MNETILIGKGRKPVEILPGMANRHGLVAGATGTGKTVTLQRLAESFSRIGVPVFLADVKGDLAGISQTGGDNRKVAERVADMSLQAAGFEYAPCPVTFWDVLGQQGHPVRTTLTEMGPLLLARLMRLNEVQEGVLNIVFRLADENGWLLLDLKDLRALLAYVAENAGDLRSTYGNVSKASVGAIQRRLLTMEEQGADNLFGEPALDLADLMQTDQSGQGYVNVLAADKLIHTPTLYSTFLLWLLSELFEQLPEVGDPERPKLVFFFDEAHLLFDRAPRVLLDKVEQVVRLIRSKGVGVYFVTQNPTDVPEDVLGQLGNRVQHALRAFTPKDQKAVRVAAETFRPNPALDTQQVITELGVGEALASTLNEEGTPSVVERILVAPPGSRLGPIEPREREALMRGSLVQGVYEEAVDRESAYEILQKRAEEAAEAAQTEEAAPAPEPKRKSGTSRSRRSPFEAFATSAMRSIGTQIGRSLVRGILGSLTGGRRR
ncbi:MAG: helicase HerA-like domain-containing protein [Pseudomonadota bacterium]|nr:helicase HerA-like domain-containing protein [Pseudomonadota bacterium]